MPTYSFDTSIEPGDIGQTDWANAVGTALNALGPLVDTKVASNDARLSDTRTPTDGSVSTAKLADGSVSTAKLADGSVSSAKIADGTIVNADINASAAIAQSKIANLSTDLAAKAPLASPSFTGTPTGITKAHVGLGSVDNTADSAKPVSSPQQTALNLKLNTADAPELIRDTMGTALVAGTNVTIAVNDAGDTITISSSGGGGSSTPNNEVEYNGTAWPSRPATTGIVKAYSTKHPTAPRPTWMTPGNNIGDIWIQHPDGVGVIT